VLVVEAVVVIVAVVTAVLVVNRLQEVSHSVYYYVFALSLAFFDSSKFECQQPTLTVLYFV